MLSFFRPTIPKLLFLAEWTAFILLTAVTGGLDSLHDWLVIAQPLLFFWVLANLFTALSARRESLAPRALLPLIGLGMILLDHAFKAYVSAALPEGGSVPLIPGYLHLAHMRNYAGAWVLEASNVQSLFILVLLRLVSLLMFAAAYFVHGHYVSHERRSVWADLSFLGFFAGSGSILLEELIRDWTVDYILLPGIVTPDGKDIYLYLGVIGLLVEMFLQRKHLNTAESEPTGSYLRSLARYAGEEVRAWFSR